MSTAVTSDFDPPPRGEVPHVNVTRDVNGDGRDDLVVPHLAGFWVFVQIPGGAFADPVKIGPSTGMDRIYGADGYRYDPWGSGRVHEMDYDRDGRTDLVFWNEDHFEVHLQDERGLFDPTARTFTTDVAFDSDELASLAVPPAEAGEQSSYFPAVLIGDVNGDGRSDLLVQNGREELRVFVGVPGPDLFARQPQKVAVTMPADEEYTWLVDLNKDGKPDILMHHPSTTEPHQVTMLITR